MRYLSVCSGIEAVSVAWAPLGWQPAMFAEIDPFCCWLLRSRYRASRPVFMPSPHDAFTRKEAKRRATAIRNIVALPADGNVINAGDFTRIGKNDVGAIDLLAGGTPCQSFSIAGKRAGLDDPRGNLTIEFARLADRLRPTWVVWENVPGVLSIELGYGLAWRILDAQFFGVSQRRRRVFVVGHLGGWRGPASVLFEFACLSGHPPPRRETRKDVAPTLSARAHGGGGPGTDFDLDGGLISPTAYGGNNTAGAIDVSTAINACSSASGRVDFDTETFIAHPLYPGSWDAGEDGTGRGTPMVPVTIRAANPRSNHDGSPDDVLCLPDSDNCTFVAFNLRGRDGGAMPETSQTASLRSASGGSSNSYLAFSQKDSGADADVIAPTLRGMGHDGSHENGGGQIAIAISANQRGEIRERTVHGSLNKSRSSKQFDGVIDERRSAAPLTASYGKQIDSSDSGSGPPNLFYSQMAVRRLTPRECERLQGFPDDYTLIDYRAKPAADGPRYWALGNSMAVPVMRWIGERIAAVDAVLREGGIRRLS